MTSRQDWFSLFSAWPKGLPRGGVLVTTLNETIAFKDFWLKDQLLLVERVAPDAMGARFVILNYEVVNIVKFTNPLTAKDIAAAGFSTEIARRPPAQTANKLAADKLAAGKPAPGKPAAAKASAATTAAAPVVAPVSETPRTPVG